MTLQHFMYIHLSFWDISLEDKTVSFCLVKIWYFKNSWKEVRLQEAGIFSFSNPKIGYIPYLTLPIVYSACPPLMSHTLCSCIFLGIIVLCHPTHSSAGSFLMLRSPTKLWMPSGKNSRYYVINYSSRPNILIHSPEVAKISKPAPLDFFSATNYTEIFMEFLDSDMLFKSDPTDPANHTIVSWC